MATERTSTQLQNLFLEYDPQEWVEDLLASIPKLIDVSSSWTAGITEKAIGIGDYSNAVALGSVSEHYLGIVSHYSATVDDSSNMIPILGKFTTAGDSGSAVAQGVYGFVDVDHNIADAYGVRGRVSVATGQEISQIFGVFGTLDTAAATLGASGMVAGLASEVSGSGDITGGGYGKVCGIYVSWKESDAMTQDTAGIYVANHASMALDSGVRVNSSGSLTNVFHAHNTGGNPTTVLRAEGGFTNLIHVDSSGGCYSATDVSSNTEQGHLQVKVGSNTYGIALYDQS